MRTAIRGEPVADDGEAELEQGGVPAGAEEAAVRNEIFQRGATG